MITRTVCRFVCAVVIIMLMFGFLVGSSLVADNAKTSLTLSEALSQVKLFADLTDAERDALKTVATLRQGKVGERIIRQGKTLGKMYIILKGDAEVQIDGKPFVTLTGQPLVGEIEFLDGLPATADVILGKETILIEFDNAALTRLMEKQPRLGYVLMREIARIEAQRLRQTSTKKDKKN